MRKSDRPIRANTLDAARHLHRAAELFRAPKASPADLPGIVELLTCCSSHKERAAVCLVKYRGLSLRAAGEILQITGNEVAEQLQGVGRRRDAAIGCMRSDEALRRGDQAAKASIDKGQTMTLAELEGTDMASVCSDKAAAGKPLLERDSKVV